MTTKRIAALLLACPLLGVQAAPPDAGLILQQIQPPALAAPALPSENLSVIRADTSDHAQSSQVFFVKVIQFEGNQIVDTATLKSLVFEGEGKSLTLPQFEQVISRISDYYANRGYPLTRAVIPAQTIHEGVVTVKIIEAHYGNINLDNHSLVGDSLINKTLSTLQSEHDIETNGLDRVLLLMSDLPGVVVNATLTPGATVSTSDLMVSLSPTPAISGTASLDNYGGNAIGRTRIGSSVTIIDPLNLKSSDTLSVMGLSSGSSGLNYGRIAYESVINGEGTRVGGAFSSLRYDLGGASAASNSNGNAQVKSLWLKHPLIRQRDVNLYGQIQYDGLNLNDDTYSGASKRDRHLENWSLILNGDVRDDLLGANINIWNIGVTTGRVVFDDAQMESYDASTVKTQGNFSKLNINLARLHSLGPTHSFYLSFVGQWANKNLDTSQKLSAGGPNSVRAYDSGAVSGDMGYVFNAEYRHNLGSVMDGQLQAVAFLDSAVIDENKTPSTASTTQKNTSLSGAGLGINWVSPTQWSAKVYLATPIGSEPNLSETNSTRLWLEVDKGF